MMMFRVAGRCGGVLCWWVLVLHAAVAPGADRFWISPEGGSFISNTNWSTSSGGPGGASRPNTNDTAIFDVDGTYLVSNFSVTNLRLRVERGNVTFPMFGNTHTLTASTDNVIGRLPGETARMTIIGGTLAVDTDGDDIEIGGSFQTSRGFLTIGRGAALGGNVGPRPDLHIGRSGQGTLTVENGGDVFATFARIGESSFATGAVTVRDLGSTMDFASFLSVGDDGAGVLNVLSGGHVSAESLGIGRFPTSNGDVSVTGSGSQIVVDTSLTVGGRGIGALSVSSAGRITSDSLLIGDGQFEPGHGAVSVAGTGSRWDVLGTDVLHVGRMGTGLLTVSAGGVVASNASSLNIGEVIDAVGQTTVTGNGSLLSTADLLVVGNEGSGELAVTAGGQVAAASIIVGNSGRGTGVVDVAGAGSRLTISGNADVAVGGFGSFRVRDGGELDVGADLFIRDPAGVQIGAFHIDGGAVYVGRNFQNDGTFTFADGLLQVTGDFQPLPSPGTFTINGDDHADLPTVDLVGNGAISNFTQLTVGDDRTGMLLLRQGRAISLSGLDIAAQAGGRGEVRVESGALLTASNTIAAGGTGIDPGGAGTLVINDGGTVDVAKLRVYGDGKVDLHGGRLRVDSLFFDGGGDFDWTTGRLEMDAANTVLGAAMVAHLMGAEAMLRPGQTLATAEAGQTIALATPLTVAGGAIQAEDFFNRSTLHVYSGSVAAVDTFNNDGPLTLAGGMLRADDFVNVSSLLIQSGSVQTTDDADNAGLVILAHPLAAFGGRSVGNDGTIRGTGRVFGLISNNATGQIEVIAGERMVLDGTLTNRGHVSVIGGELQVTDEVTNASSAGLISARDAILRFDGGLANNGGLAMSNGAVDVYGNVRQNRGGRITVSGGGIANFYDDVEITTDAPDVQATAVGATTSSVVFFGSYNGGVTGGGDAFIEGDHRPGNSPALVTFEGNVAYGPFSALSIELAGTMRGSEYDAIDVAGVANLAGTLDVSLIDGFVPAVQDEFRLLSAAGGLQGVFDAQLLPSLGSVVDWTVSYGTSDVILRVVSALPGDTNNDGRIDVDDLNNVRNNFGGMGPDDGTLPGDAFPFDGLVNIDDLNGVRNNFGAVAQVVLPVPEPAGLLTALLASLFLATLRRRRSSR